MYKLTDTIQKNNTDKINVSRCVYGAGWVGSLKPDSFWTAESLFLYISLIILVTNWIPKC